MKITRRQLKELIKEEVSELEPPPDLPDEEDEEASLNEAKPRLSDRDHATLKKFVDNSFTVVSTVIRGNRKKEPPWSGVSFQMMVQLGQARDALEKLQKLLR